MKKKFKRSVRDRTTAKIRRRRILSSLLAVSVFVSNGLLGSPPKIDFTAVAEGEDISEPIEESIDSGPAEENNIENPDDSEQTDEDGESTDVEDVPAVEDEEISNAEDDIEQPDVEEGQTDEDIEIFAEDVAVLDEGDGEGSTDTPPATTITPVFEIRVRPDKYPDTKIDAWDNKTYGDWENHFNNTKENPYVVRVEDKTPGVDTQTINICGVTTNFEIIECDGNCSEEDGHLKATNKIKDPGDWRGGYKVDPDHSTVCFKFKENPENVFFQLVDDNGATNYKSSKISIDNSNRSYEIIPDDKGNKMLLISSDINCNEITAENMTTEGEGIVTRKLVFNDGTQGMAVEDYPNWQQMYISVRPETSYIEVYSEVMNRDMNHVNEYVNDANLGSEARAHVKGTTIENSKNTPYMLLRGDSVYIRGIADGKPIKDNMMSAFTGGADDANSSLLGRKDWEDGVVYRDKIDISDTTYTKNGNDGFIKLTVPQDGAFDYCYYLNYNTGLTDVDGTTVYERFYFKICNDTNFWDHSDIEISDGGTYTITTEEFEGDKKYAYVVEYSIDVTDVNKCEIYGGKTDNQDNKPSEAEGAKPLKIKNQFWDSYDAEQQAYYKGIIDKLETGEALTDEEKDDYDRLNSVYEFPREMTYIPANDYWKDPAILPGDDQFELTSKYVRSDTKASDGSSIVDSDGNRLKDANGKPLQGEVILDSIKDNLKYQMKEVGGAKFYLQLLLTPQKVTRYEIDENGNHLTAGKNLSPDDYDELTIPNAEFPMSYQSVLDAFNKCPDHSGLDFTIKSNVSEIIQINPIQELIQAKKTLENKALTENQFSFELYYVPNAGATPDLIETVSNKADGSIVFKKQPFVAVGEYHYQIKEVIDSNDNSIVYDTGIIDVTINVIKTADNKLTATTTYSRADKSQADSSAPLSFVNIYKVYNLPSAGGKGVYIYIISGAGLMLSAAVMYRRKRKEE